MSPKRPHSRSRTRTTRPDQQSPTAVRRGGVAATDADAEDVTRDTYGFPASPPRPADARQRIANAEREAEQLGIPGVELPEEEHPERPSGRRPAKPARK